MKKDIILSVHTPNKRTQKSTVQKLKGKIDKSKITSLSEININSRQI